MTLLAPTGERMAFYEAARQYDQEALRVIASVCMDENQPAALRLAAANDLFPPRRGFALRDAIINSRAHAISPANIAQPLLYSS